jgi:hypothetical protein
MTNEKDKENQGYLIEASKLLDQIVSAIKKGEAFIVNGTFENGGRTNAVFFAGGYPDKQVLETFKLNNKLIADHLEGKKTVQQNMAELKKSTAKIEKKKDGGISIQFNK